MHSIRALSSALLSAAVLGGVHSAVAEKVVPSIYTKTMEIAVSGYSGAETLTDFPVLVTLSPTNQTGFAYADFKRADGKELAFADADGNLLPYDIDTWNQANNSDSLVWVKVPSLTKDTKITAYWGSETETANVASNVWSNYAAVYHFGSDKTDATGHNLPVVERGSGIVSSVDTGLLGLKYTTGSNNKLTIGEPTQYLKDGGQVTLSLWYKNPRSSGTDAVSGRFICSKTTYSDTSNGGFDFLTAGNGNIWMRGAKYDGGKSNTETFKSKEQPLTPKVWKHLVAVYDGTSAQSYCDGVALTASQEGGISPATKSKEQVTGVGGYGTEKVEGTWPGDYDEVRFYNGVASADYIVAEYQTVAQRFSFVSYGSVGNVDRSQPAVANGDVASVGDTEVVLNAAITTLGGAATGDLTLEFGPDTDTISSVTSNAVAIGNVQFAISNLEPVRTYVYRYVLTTASATAASEWTSVTTTGLPVFGEVTVAGNPIDGVSVGTTLATRGHSAPNVALYFGTSAETLTAVTPAWESASTETDLTKTLTTGFNWGDTVYAAYKAEYAFNDRVIAAWSVTNSLTLVGNIVWNGTGSDWTTAANWSPNVVPSEILPAFFTVVGGTVEASDDAMAQEVSIDAGEPVTFDFGQHRLVAEALRVATNTPAAQVQFKNGDYAFTNVIRVGGNPSGEGLVKVASGATVSGKDLYLGQDSGTGHNELVVTDGGSFTLSGKFFARRSQNNGIIVTNGAACTVNEIELWAPNNFIVVDGGSFTNLGATLNAYASGNKPGEGCLIRFANGANGRFVGDLNANYCYNGRFEVLSGSHVVANKVYLSKSGQALDMGGNGRLVVSNAVLEATSVSAGDDDRFPRQGIQVYADQGATSKLSVSANLQIGSSAMGRANAFNYENFLAVAGGKVTVGGTLVVGDNGQYQQVHSNNQVRISCANSTITADTFRMKGVSQLCVAIPENGFDAVPLQVTGAASFETNSTVFVDVSDWKGGRQKLLTAGSISGLTADQVSFVTKGASQKPIVKLTETELTVSMPNGFSLILR